jgi:hypothetical protein
MRYKADIGQALPMDLCLHFSVRRAGLSDINTSREALFIRRSRNEKAPRNEPQRLAS